MSRVVGIDLGTTNSCVAVIDGDTPVVIANAEGSRTTPSVVGFAASGERLVGQAARRQAVTNAENTIYAVKRLMGRKFDDDEVARQLATCAYEIVAADNGDAHVMARGRTYAPPEVSAMVLGRMRETAEAWLGEPVTEAVITVPAYFDDAQRQATKDASRIAGLNVLRIINEPTAAALAYGFDKKKAGTIAVYDLGGGTFDVSILDLRDGIFTVMATAGDTALGGDDMDHALADLLLAGHPQGAAITADPGRVRAVLESARAIKHRLTTEDQVSADLFGVERTVTRAELDAAIAPILSRTATPCRRALKDAELKPEELDGVILVGGATRVPAVRRFVAELFKREALCDLDPDQVVALGAAVQADLLASDRTDALLIDVTPLSLGLELMGGVVEKILPRNSRVPCGAKQTFTTYADGQTGFDLHVVQGERETAAECRSLARFKLTGLPRMAAGMARLEVAFLVDENGILSVSAQETTSGKEAHVQVKPSYGLSDEQIEQMLLDSFENAETDVRTRLLVEQRVEADRILAALAAALAADGRLLSPEERSTIEAARDSLAAARSGTDHRSIAAAIEALDVTSKEFAQRRMNQSLDAAVTGRSVHEIEQAVHYDPAAPETGPQGVPVFVDPESRDS